MKKILLTTCATLIGMIAFATIKTISVASNTYTPSTLSINLGDTVRFNWVSGNHPTQADNGEWTTFPMNSGATSTDVVLTQTGTVPYFCQAHGGSGGSGMSGSITVNAAISGTIHTIDVASNNYTPSTLTIAPGDIVRFNWISGNHPTAADNGEWTTTPMSSAGDNFDVMLTQAGTVPYYCTNHGGIGGTGMSGVITVQSITTPPAYNGVIVKVKNNTYTPDSVHIDAGDTVRFEWVEGNHPTESVDASWSTFQMTVTDTMFDVILNTDGVYNYFCQNHGSTDGNNNVSGMSGKIVVGDPVIIDGVSKNINNTFLVGPNPFTESISIIHNFDNLTSIEVTNLIGSKVKSFKMKDYQNISLSDLENGIYFIKAYDNNNDLLKSVKVIKK